MWLPEVGPYSTLDPERHTEVDGCTSLLSLTAPYLKTRVEFKDEREEEDEEFWDLCAFSI